MSITEIGRDISLEEIQRRLSDALGHGYKVTVTSDSTLKFRRTPLMTSKVNVNWYEDGTNLAIVPGEVWILQGINALTLYPKVRHTVSRAFPGAS